LWACMLRDCLLLLTAMGLTWVRVPSCQAHLPSLQAHHRKTARPWCCCKPGKLPEPFQELNWLVPWSTTSQSLSLWEINVCYLKKCFFKLVYINCAKGFHCGISIHAHNVL
jgi:hypothetical protein